MSAKKAVRHSQQWGTAILLASAVIVKLVGALFKIPLSSSRCLGEVGFGRFSSAYDLFSPLYALAMTGLPVAVAKTVAGFSADGRPDKARNAYAVARRGYFAVGLIGTVAFALLVVPFLRFTESSLSGSPALFAAAPAVLFSCLLSAGRGYYEGVGNMYPTAISELIEAACKLALGLGGAYFTVCLTGNVAYGAAAAIAGISLGVLAATLFTEFYAHFKGDRIKSTHSLCDKTDVGLKECLYAALLTGPVALTASIPPLIDAFTVKRGLSALIAGGASLPDAAVSAAEPELWPIALYGIRGKAYTVFNLVPALTAVIAVAAVPAATKALKNGGSALRSAINTALKSAALISFPAAFGLILLGDRLMALLYDTEASAQIGGRLLSIYGVAALFVGFLMPLAGILQAAGRQKKVLFNTACGAAAGFAAVVLLLKFPQINIAAAPCGAVVCFFVIFLLDTVCLRRAVGFWPDFKAVLAKPLISALLCGLAARAVAAFGRSNLITDAAVLCGGAVYLLVLCLCGGLEKSDFPPEISENRIIKFCEKHRIIR